MIQVLAHSTTDNVLCPGNEHAPKKGVELGGYLANRFYSSNTSNNFKPTSWRFEYFEDGLGLQRKGWH